MNSCKNMAAMGMAKYRLKARVSFSDSRFPSRNSRRMSMTIITRGSR